MRFLLAPILLTALLVFLVGCPRSGSGASSEAHVPLADRVVTSSRHDCTQYAFRWGTGEDELGLVAPAAEALGRGPQALAVAPDGAIHILDAVNERLVSIDSANASLRVVGSASITAEDLAISSRGRIAFYSPLHTSVSLLNPNSQVEPLPIPRLLRGVTGIAFDENERLILRNAFQERFLVGSFAAPLDESSILRSKREGAFETEDGKGLYVRLVDRRAELWTADPVLTLSGADAPRSGATALGSSAPTALASDTRVKAEKQMSFDRPADAARIVGIHGPIVCLRFEELASQEPLKVGRYLACADLASESILFERDLPSAGLYAPRHDVAMGGEDLLVAFMVPNDDGMQISACEVQR